MNTASTFRHTLARRLWILLALPTTVGGCIGGSTSCPETEPQATTACFAWPPESTGTGGGGGGTGGGSAVDPNTCPSEKDAETRLNEPFIQNHTVTGAGTLKDGQCCYPALVIPICEGRPYLIEEIARTAPTVPARGGEGWSEAPAGAPRLDDLDAERRATLAAAWTRDALFEHASVASFGRFALELLAAGAPADLVEDAHRAALDEVRHARLCFALAGTYTGEPTAPGAFPFHGRVDVASDLASIAARTVKEGCIGETVAAILAAERRDAAQDPAVRATLSIMAEDEARHAELAWRTVAWAIHAGGVAVREAVEAALADLGGSVPEGDEGAHDVHLAAHGVLAGDALREAAARALDEVVRPAARLLVERAGARTAVLTSIGSAEQPSA